MEKTKINCVKSDTSSLEYKEWSKWLRKAAALTDRHLDKWRWDDPFAYNENASVAFLSAAGALAGYATLAEYKNEKYHPKTKAAKKQKYEVSEGQRETRLGRGDLCMHTAANEWAFEFKQHNCRRFIKKDGLLRSLMASAKKGANDLIEELDGKPVAALVVSLYYIEADDLHKKISREIEAFACENVQHCWSLEVQNYKRRTYFMFNLINNV